MTTTAAGPDTADPKAADPEGAGAAPPARSVEYLAGYSDGYRAARAVLDDAAAYLSQTLRPADALDVAAARAEAAAARGPAITGDELRARAYTSWDLPLPPDLAGEHDETAASNPVTTVVYAEEAL